MTQEIFKSLAINEEYYDLVPRPTKEERQLLKESIIINGQREAIIVNQKGIILDGHSRYEICQELGREPKYLVKQFLDNTQEMAYVIDANLSRRQLSPFSKVELSYGLYRILREKGRERQRTHTKGIRSSEILGQNVGLSPRTVSTAIFLIETADAKTKNLLRKDLLSINQAYMRIRKPPHANRKPNNISSSSILKCPKCEQEFPRSKLQVVKY